MKFLKLLYKKEITPIFMVKILDFNCEKFLTKSHVFFDLRLLGFSLEICFP